MSKTTTKKPAVKAAPAKAVTKAPAPKVTPLASTHGVETPDNPAAGTPPPPNGVVLTDADAAADLAGLPRPIVNEQAAPAQPFEGVSTLAQAQALPVIAIDLAAVPVEHESPNMIRAFKAADGRTLRVVHHEGVLCAQPIEA